MKNNLIKIIKVRKCFFSYANKILIQALDDCEAIFNIANDDGIVFCLTLYRIQKNHMLWIEVPKSLVFSKNQIIDFSVVCNKSCTHLPCDGFRFQRPLFFLKNQIKIISK